jgi:hypothetical protein
MQRARARLPEELAEQVAVEPREREPLRAPGRPGDDVDVLGAEPALADDGERLGAGAEGERGGQGPRQAGRRDAGSRCACAWARSVSSVARKQCACVIAVSVRFSTSSTTCRP